MAGLRGYRTVSDLPELIPVFPLLGAIVLPRTVLPLNVFEPRYLAMVDSVLAGNRIIGMVQPVADGGTTGSPQSRKAPLRTIGCAARLVAFQEQPDGRMLITLAGLARFETVGEPASGKPFRELSVSYSRFVHDLEPGHGQAGVDRDGLLSVLRRFLAARNLQADWVAIEKSETEDLVNSLAAASPFGPTEKQALVEASTLADRARALITLAEMDLAAGSGSPGSRLQ